MTLATTVDPKLARNFCFKCMVTIVLILGVIIASLMYLKLNLAQLFTIEAMLNMASYVGRFFPPDFSHPFLQKIGKGILETLAISALATLIAASVSIVLALPMSGRYGAWAQSLTRFLCNFLRSVPELVWAALMVLAVGLGPFAGTLALALHTTGVLSRLFGESLENLSPTACEALKHSGASRISSFLYGTLPGIAPQLLSYSLYRWEMNIRMATVLGFVGAGGLGQMLYYELSLLREPQAATVIIAMLGLIIVVDNISNKLRRIQMHSLG